MVVIHWKWQNMADTWMKTLYTVQEAAHIRAATVEEALEPMEVKAMEEAQKLL